MNHSEAVEQMAVERYLLDELEAADRENFEEHMFGCSECALDTRVATAFIEGAKTELAELAPIQPERKPAAARKESRAPWLFAWRPAFAAPVFAALAGVICYQNLVTLPGLRKAADQPALIPVAPLSGATRGGARAAIAADRSHGIALPVDIPLDPAIGVFVSYSFQMYNPQGKLAWSATLPAPAQTSAGDLQLSLAIPGGMLQNGAYSVSISGTGAHGENTPLEHYSFNIALTK